MPDTPTADGHERGGDLGLGGSDLGGVRGCTPHPFAVPEGSDASMFIQWKGTDVCLDFHCPCGRSGHYDGYFAYAIRCACGAIYEMGTQVIARRNDTFVGTIVDLDDDTDYAAQTTTTSTEPNTAT